MSRCIWALIDEERAEHLMATAESSAKQYTFTMIDALPHYIFVKLSMTLWATWSSRRKAIHDYIFQGPLSISFIRQ